MRQLGIGLVAPCAETEHGKVQHLLTLPPACLSILDGGRYPLAQLGEIEAHASINQFGAELAKHWLTDLRTRVIQVRSPSMVKPAIIGGLSEDCRMSGLGADRLCIGFLCVVQHNIRVLSRYYKKIRLTRAAELLNLSVAEVGQAGRQADGAAFSNGKSLMFQHDMWVVRQLEKNIATLVSDGSLYAKVDRPANQVSFSKPKVGHGESARQGLCRHLHVAHAVLCLVLW